MGKIKINIYAIVGDSLCISSEDGNKVFKQITKALDMDKKIEISFLNVEMVTAAFLSSAIGQLYGANYTEEKLKKSLSAIDISNEHQFLLKRVIETAKLYYKDLIVYESRFKEVMEGV